MAEWACTVFHNARTRRQQGNCVAVASHHARKLCSTLSENILETKNRKCSKSSEENWRKDSFKTLKCTDMYATSISGNPSEMQKSGGHTGGIPISRTELILSPVICPKFLWRESTSMGSGLGKPFLYSSPCLGLTTLALPVAHQHGRDPLVQVWCFL